MKCFLTIELLLSRAGVHWLDVPFVVVCVIALVSVILLIRQHLYFKSSNRNNSIINKEQQFFKQLIDHMPDRIYFKDRESRFILGNKYVSMIMGEKDPSKLIGKSDFDYYDKSLAKNFFEDEQKIMESGEPIINKEEKGLDPEGNEIFVSTTKIPIKDKNENVVGIVGIGRDISPQKAAENELNRKTESLREVNRILKERQEKVEKMARELKQVNNELERLSMVASNTENTVIITDSNGNLEWANKGFEKNYNVTLEAFIRKNGRNLREASSKDNIDIILNQIAISKKPFTYNSKYKNSDGSEIWSQTNISPIINDANEITNLILIDSDITELKLAEAKIKKQKLELEKASKKLQHLNNTKDRLFSVIAHDLRSPLQSIISLTELLQQRYKEFDQDKIDEMIEMVNQSTNIAYQLLENLLEWGRTQMEHINFNPTQLNLHLLVNENISLLSHLATNKDIHLINNVPEDIYACADHYMLNTIIRNLTSNALKYSRPGGSVKFTGRVKNGDVFLEISDTGIGMSKEKTKNLFRIDDIVSTSGTSGEVGTGLGLIICKEFIKINQGSITVKSEEGKGTRFIIKLPKENH